MKKSLVFYAIACLLYPACKEQSTTTPASSVGLYLPDSLEATLFAASPMIHNPTNVDREARGRVWVTEAVNYRNFNNDSTRFFHYDKGDRIVILEDRNDD